jgi:zinc protease
MRTTLALVFIAAAAAPAQVRLPAYTREVLPNGVVLVMSPRAGVPLVHIRVDVRGGTESEPEKRAGISSVTAELLRRGTSKRTPDQFSEEIDSLGAVFRTGADEQSTTIAGEFLKKDFDIGLDLVADAVLRPSFPEPEVKKLLARRMDAIRTSRDNPAAAMSSYWRAYFFGSAHPYGRPADEISLERLRRDDIADYHKRMYTGANLVVILTGDFDSKTAREKVIAAFGQVPRGTAWAWLQEPAPPNVSGPRLLLIDKPDATQTYFRIGRPGIARTNPDRVTLWLVNTLFGGRFTSMLNDELRINTGLTYGARSVVEESRLTRGIFIDTYTKTDTTGKAIDLALELLKRLNEKGITTEQLASAKAYLKGTFPPGHLETIDQVAGELAELEMFGLSRAEIDTLFARLDAVTVERANAAIRKYYAPRNLTFLVLGNAAKIRESIAKYSPQISERSIRQPGWGS